MSGHLIAIVAVVVIVWLALGALVFALLPGRAHRRPPLPVRGHWDENAQRWTTARAVGLGALDAADLDEIDALEHLLSLPAYGTDTDHTTTTAEEAGDA
ncbi:MAG TPA: hypothetical protein VN088_01430 [Nocardioides sp.]|nr:hypothetical protein [Nocardioides sp.]